MNLNHDPSLPILSNGTFSRISITLEIHDEPQCNAHTSLQITLTAATINSCRCSNVLTIRH